MFNFLNLCSAFCIISSALYYNSPIFSLLLYNMLFNNLLIKNIWLLYYFFLEVLFICFPTLPYIYIFYFSFSYFNLFLFVYEISIIWSYGGSNVIPHIFSANFLLIVNCFLRCFILFSCKINFCYILSVQIQCSLNWGYVFFRENFLLLLPSFPFVLPVWDKF